MFPEITIKIVMHPEGVQVTQSESSASSTEFSVPVLPAEQRMEEYTEYFVPSIAEEEMDVIEDYTVPSVPNEDDNAGLDLEFSVPAIPDMQERQIEDEFSIPVTAENELDDGTETVVPK
jgi:hypothetical protein